MKTYRIVSLTHATSLWWKLQSVLTTVWSVDIIIIVLRQLETEKTGQLHEP